MEVQVGPIFFWPDPRFNIFEMVRSCGTGFGSNQERQKKGVKYDLRWYDSSGFRRSEAAGTNSRTAEPLCKKKEWELNQGLVIGTECISYDKFVKEHIELRQGTFALP